MVRHTACIDYPGCDSIAVLRAGVVIVKEQPGLTLHHENVADLHTPNSLTVPTRSKIDQSLPTRLSLSRPFQACGSRVMIIYMRHVLGLIKNPERYGRKGVSNG